MLFISNRYAIYFKTWHCWSRRHKVSGNNRTLYAACLPTHSVSLGMTSIANHSTVIFSVPQALKNLKSPTKQKTSPDNFNIVLMFNNKIYIDFRTAYLQTRFNSKLRYSSHLTEPECDKTKHSLVVWLKQAKSKRLTFEIEPSVPYIILQSLVWQGI